LYIENENADALSRLCKEKDINKVENLMEKEKIK
jgi:hypothetical protein